AVYGDHKPRRISLPAYPFAKERYWIETAAGTYDAAPAAPSVLHPLLHSNTSDLNEQRYRSLFTGEEFFLADHRVTTNGHGADRMLPGVAYLEMARAAIQHAVPIPPASSILDLQDTVWLQPLVVTAPTHVSVAVFANDDETVDYE